MSPPGAKANGAPADEDHPFQMHLDEARVRKADNDTVERWKALSGPWFAAHGEAAAGRWTEIGRALAEIVRRPLGSLETERQRGMYREIMEPRLAPWSEERMPDVPAATPTSLRS